MLPTRFYPVFSVCFESALSIILTDFDGVKQRFLQGQKNEMEKDEIKDKLDILESKINALVGRFIPATPAPCTLYEWLAEWLAVYKSPDVSRKWREVLRHAVARVMAALPDKPLNEYTPAELSAALYSVPDSMTYTRWTVYHVLKNAFRQAVRLGYILSSPLDKLAPVIHTRECGRALTVDEQARFLQSLDGDKRKPLYLFYLLSGCRCAEGLALKWTDIDENAGRIHIGGTKTVSADRYIPLFPQIRAVLDDLPRGSVRVFPFTYDGLKSHFQRLKRRCGFSFRLHDLRHTFATRCLESGINILTVSKWLGHSSITVTAGVYSHIQPDFERQEVERFNPKITTE